MKYCRRCGSDSKIYESRPTKEGFVLRRRECQKCHFRWMTIEVDYWDYAQMLQKQGDKDAELL